MGQVLLEPDATVIDGTPTIAERQPQRPTDSRCAWRDFWAPVFAARPIDEKAADDPIRRDIRPTGGRDISSTTTTIRATLRRLRDTAPGLDGLPYSAWRSGGRDAANTLRCTLCQAAATSRFPDRFCDAVVVFLPKGSSRSDNAATGRRDRLAQDTRPLALLDTAAKTIISLVNRPLAALMDKWAPKQQQGFVINRGTVRNILMLDMAGRILSLRASTTTWRVGDGDEDDDATMVTNRRDARHADQRKRMRQDETATTSATSHASPATTMRTGHDDDDRRDGPRLSHDIAPTIGVQTPGGTDDRIRVSRRQAHRPPEKPAIQRAPDDDGRRKSSHPDAPTMCGARTPRADDVTGCPARRCGPTHCGSRPRSTPRAHTTRARRPTRIDTSHRAIRLRSCVP